MRIKLLGKISKLSLQREARGLISTGNMIALLLFMTISVRGEWVPFSPEGIKAHCIAFYVDYENHWAVGSNDTYLYDLVNQSWTSYFSILPVKDISFMDGDYVLLMLESNPMLMEEGIHYLDPESGIVYALQYLTSPQFIQYNYGDSRYYVGYYMGLKYSDNFTDWYDDPYFFDMFIVDMEMFGDHYVVSRTDNLYGVYYSDDAGATWSFSEGSPMISDLEFDLSGKLYGVFPGESWSSGLWSSNDFGITWNVEFWATGINCVGTDFMNNVFVGFGEGPHSHEGIVRWDSINQQLYPMNTGLSNLNINQITYNPAMSAPAMFCCTDSGAYVNYTYLNINEQDEGHQPLILWPNPSREEVHLRHRMTGKLQLDVFSIDGRLLDSITFPDPESEIIYTNSKLDAGVYIIVLDNGVKRSSIKWICK